MEIIEVKEIIELRKYCLAIALLVIEHRPKTKAATQNDDDILVSIARKIEEYLKQPN